MTTPEQVLAQVPLFSMLPKKQLAHLASEARDRTFPAGAVLTDEDRTGTSFGVIMEGRAAGPHPRPRRLLRRDGADRPLPPVGEDHRRDGAALPAVRLVDLPPVRHAAPGDGLGAAGDDGATRPRRRSPLRAEKPAYGLDRRN